MQVISGGQIGVDQLALRLAKEYGHATGGWMPKRWLTIEGPRPEFEHLYGMRECPVEGYPPRTALNVRDGHITLWFGDDDSRGKTCTRKAAKSLKRPFVHCKPRTPESVLRLLRLHARIETGHEFNGAMVLNVAGTRYLDSPGGREAEEFLTALFEWYKLWL